MAARFPLHKPDVGDAEEHAVLRALRDGHLAGNGPECRALEAVAGAILGTGQVLAVNSGTSALEMACMVLDIGPGDEVVLPSFTFVTTATAVLRTGATPVFCDVDPLTGNVTAETLEARCSPATRAVIVVHYGGNPCEMEAILEFAERRGLRVIEDAAHALGATWRGRAVGTIGDVGCFSLHATKHAIAGEGGLLALREPRLAARARVIREKGTDRQDFAEGRAAGYRWIEVGSSFTLSDLLAALATVQLRRLAGFLESRRQVAGWYRERLEALEADLPGVSPEARPSWHIYPIQVEASRRREIIDSLAERGIEAASHYPPLHLSPYAVQRLPPASRERLEHTEAIAARVLRLPMHPGLTREDVDTISDAVLEIVGERTRPFPVVGLQHAAWRLLVSADFLFAC